MITPKNVYEQKIMEILERLGFTKSQLEAAEAYLMEGAEKEVIDTFEFEDLSTIPADPVIRLFRELVKQNKRDLAAKLLSILLAKGQSTCCRMIIMDVIDPKKGAVDTKIDADKKAAVYSAVLGADLYPIAAPSRECLIDIAGRNPETLKRAVDFEKNKSKNGRLILYAAYFFQKYKCGESEKIEIEQPDALLLSQYENIAVESLDKLFPYSHPASYQMKKAVIAGEVTEEILALARSKSNISRQMLKLIGSMAYLNYPLSKKLKGIVKICLAADVEETLNTIKYISSASSMDICIRGGLYDKEFGIDSAEYIRWAAKMRHTIILEKQLENNPDIYIKVIEDTEIETAGRMLFMIKKKNPSLYDTLLTKQKQYGYNKEIEKILNKLIRNDADASVIKAYLRGETSVDTLYPFAARQKKGYYIYSGGQERREIDNYGKYWIDGAFAFYRRFQVYMLLRHAGYFLRSDLLDCSADSSGDYTWGISTQKTVEMFQGFAYEGLSISYQLFGVGLLDIFIYGKEDKRQFLAGAEEVFGEYLKEKPEETIKAFMQADVFGKLFGLRMLAKDVQKYKKEIFFYSFDSSKTVRKEAFEILCRQKQWEKEIKELLTSRKAAQRQLAIRVLCRWQESGTDYKELFMQAYEKEKSKKVKQLLGGILGIE